MTSSSRTSWSSSTGLASARTPDPVGPETGSGSPASRSGRSARTGSLPSHRVITTRPTTSASSNTAHQNLSRRARPPPTGEAAKSLLLARPARADFAALRAVVLVMAAPPDAGFVASLRRPVEPLIHPPEPVEAARVRRIRVVDPAVLERERAHARRLPEERVQVGADALRDLRDRTVFRNVGALPQVTGLEVVLDDGALSLLLLGIRDPEVVVEVVVVRRGPREVPAHAPLVRLDVG